MTKQKNYARELKASIQTEWITALELKKNLNIADSTKSIGRTLASIAGANQDIESKKVQGLWHYRRIIPQNPQIQPDKVMIQSPQALPVQPVSGKLPIDNELKNIIHDLKDQGEDVQEICYQALTERKKKIEDEYRYVMQNAPTVAKQINRFKTEIHKLKNQMDDFKDWKSKIEGQKMLDVFRKEREAQKGIS